MHALQKQIISDIQQARSACQQMDLRLIFWLFFSNILKFLVPEKMFLNIFGFGLFIHPNSQRRVTMKMMTMNILLITTAMVEWHLLK